MTIESIKRSLSATELNRMDKKAVEHTNKIAFILKVFLETKGSIAERIRIIRNELATRSEERLSELSLISLKVLCSYSPDMEIHKSGVFIYANYETSSLVRIERENNQDYLVLYDISKDDSRLVLHAITQETLDEFKAFFENYQCTHQEIFDNAIKNLSFIADRECLDEQSVQKNYLNFMHKDMIDRYGVNFWRYAQDAAVQRKMFDRKHCIIV